MAVPNSCLFSLSCSLLIITLTFLYYPTGSLAQTLFVFGDGYYDAGNKQFIAGNKVAADAPPYGISIGKATGRWSDGLIVSDFLAGFMGIPRIPPILRSSADFTHGASFAVADATVLGSPLYTMSLSQQVMKFSQKKHIWSEKALSEAIYLTFIGSNDYLNYVKHNPNPSDDQKQAFVGQVINSIEASIKVIHEAGGRKFAFQNLPPLGCLPVVKQESGNEKECVKLPSEMAALHNKNLLNLITKLTKDLESFQYSYYDFFGSMVNRVFEPHTYIFGTGSAACCGRGPLKGTDCAIQNVCFTPDRYVFFDGKHLTQKANFQVAHLMWNSDPQVIEPNNLRELLVLPLNIPFIYNVEQDGEAITTSFVM